MITLPPPFKVRPAVPSDAVFEEALYRSTRADLQQLDAAPAVIEQLLDMQWRIHRSGLRGAFPDARAWVILRHTLPVAHFVITTSASSMHLLDLSLLPQVRRQGLGRRIMYELQRAAADTGQALTLRVAKNNTVARHLYLSLGFHSQQDDAASDFMAWRV